MARVALEAWRFLIHGYRGPVVENEALRGDLKVSERLTIPAEELTETFQTSGGPGGQHANRSATGVALSWHYAASNALNDGEKARLSAALGARGEGGALRVVADKSRSQWRNRNLARSRLADLVTTSLKPPKPRRATKPSRSAKKRRVDEKKRRSQTKSLRQKPSKHDD